MSTLKIKALRQCMQQQSIDLICLGPGMHLKWLLEIQPHADERPLLFCLSQHQAGFLMPSLEANSFAHHTQFPFFLWSDAEGPQQALEQLVQHLDITQAKQIVLDESMRVDFAKLLQHQFPQAHYQFTASTLGQLRIHKDHHAYHALKKNALIADQAMQYAWANMHSGMSENDVANLIKESFQTQQASPLFTIIATGKNGAFPHHQTAIKKLQRGEAVVMDIGATVDNYCSDITRMAIIGEAPEDYFTIHHIVNEAVEAALEVAKPGIMAKMVDKAARDVITQAGFGEYFTHRTGHGLGIELHEPPFITSTAETILEEGMVFSIEPGIYLPECFGIRLEEIVILRTDGAEVLSELSRDAIIIEN